MRHRAPLSPIAFARTFRPARPQVGCWGQADAALAELGRLRQRLEEVEQRRAAALAEAEAAARATGRELEARQRRLEATLERFCRRHREELARVNGHSRRSRRLLFGRVGYRSSQAVRVRSERAALARLARWRTGRRFLRLRRELDRDALRRFLFNGSGGHAAALAGRLRRAGIRLEQRDAWFYELDPEALGRWG